MDTPTPVPDWSQFDGIDAPNGTQIPDVFLDWIAPFLSDVELRVMLYILRRTFGFKKQADDISLRQICTGIVRHDGRRLDYGTQLSRASVTKGLRGLKEKRLVLAREHKDAEHGSRPTTYYVNIRAGGPDVDTAIARLMGVLHTEQPPASHAAAPLLHTAHPPASTVAATIDSRTTYRSNSKYTRGKYAVCAACGSRPCVCDEATG